MWALETSRPVLRGGTWRPTLGRAWGTCGGVQHLRTLQGGPGMPLT